MPGRMQVPPSPRVFVPGLAPQALPTTLASGAKRRRLVAALLVVAIVPGAPAIRAQELPQRFDPKRDAAADLARALELARAEGKRVLVDVGGEWCSWCHVMDRFFAADAEAMRLRETHYVWLKVNVSKDNANAAILERWPKVPGYPHLFVLDADGRLLRSQNTSELEDGRGYDRDRFIAFLRRWAPARPGSAASAVRP